MDFSTLTTSSSAAPAFASASAAGSPRPSEVVEAGSTLAEVGGACGSSRLSSVSAMGNNNNDVTAATASQLHLQRTWRFSHDRLLQETASSRSKRKNAQRSSRDPRRQWSGGPGGGGGGVGDGRHIAHRCVCVCCAPRCFLVRRMRSSEVQVVMTLAVRLSRPPTRVRGMHRVSAAIHLAGLVLRCSVLPRHFVAD